jgi:hypothetical protein
VERFYAAIQLPEDGIQRLRQRLQIEMAEVRTAREKEAKRLKVRLGQLQAAQDRCSKDSTRGCRSSGSSPSRPASPPRPSSSRRSCGAPRPTSSWFKPRLKRRSR